jgi:hypothetical protein
VMKRALSVARNTCIRSMLSHHREIFEATLQEQTD